jgi:PhzF family phenazine biosynthesis protein
LRDAPSIRLSTKKGEVMALNQIASHDAVYISAPPAVFSARMVPSSDCARALGSSRPSTLEFRTIVDAGLETLIVEAASLADELALAPDLNVLRAFCESIGVDIVLVYSAETSTPGCAYRTRVFAPRFGYLEDPATGSGNAAFGYHLRASGAWSQGRLRIEQNGSRDYPNFVSLVLEEQGDEKPRLLFGGSARVKIRGEYLLSVHQSK